MTEEDIKEKLTELTKASGVEGEERLERARRHLRRVQRVEELGARREHRVGDQGVHGGHDALAEGDGGAERVVEVVLEALERVALRGAVARAAPPHGVVRLGQRRRVVHERRERRADAEVADRRALAEARARVRARRGRNCVAKSPSARCSGPEPGELPASASADDSRRTKPQPLASASVRGTRTPASTARPAAASAVVRPKRCGAELTQLRPSTGTGHELEVLA